MKKQNNNKYFGRTYTYPLKKELPVTICPLKKEDFNLSNTRILIPEKIGESKYWYPEDKLKEFLFRFEKYIRGQNFNGTSFRLKSNIINRLRELAGEKLNSDCKSKASKEKQ